MYPYRSCPHCSQEDVSPWYNPCEHCHGTGFVIRTEKEIRFHKLLYDYVHAREGNERDRIEEALLALADEPLENF